jgi:fucose permease
LTLLLGCLALAAVGLQDGALGVAWPAIRTSLALPQSGLGLLIAASGTGVFAAALMAGQVMQRVAFPTLLLAAAGAMALGAAGEAASPATLPLVLCAFLAGLGAGTLDSATNAAAALRFSAREVNWMHGCFGIGATIGPLLMTALLTGAGLSWRIGYAILAIALAAIALTLRGGAAAAAAPIPVRQAGHADWSAATRHKLVWLHIVLFFVYTGLELMLGQWCYTVLTEAHGVAPALAGSITAAYWLSLAAGRFALGALATRIGPDRLTRAATAATLAGTLLFAFGDGLLGVAGLLLAGAALAPIFPTLMSRAPARLGADVAVHAVGFGIGGAIAGGVILPAAAGLIGQRFGLDAIAWMAVATALALAVLHETVLARSARAVATAP